MSYKTFNERKKVSNLKLFDQQLKDCLQYKKIDFLEDSRK